MNGTAIRKRAGRSEHRRGQSGIALFVLIALTGLLAFVAVLNLVPKTNIDQAREQVTDAALARAKQALIAYAISRMDEFADQRGIPGRLPCPSTRAPATAEEEGSNSILHPDCLGQYETVAGRLPWKTLGIEPLRDGYGECLWYVVAGNYKGGPQAGAVLNWDALGQLVIFASDGVTRLAGSTTLNQAVAAVIAPGPAIEGSVSQVRDRVANTQNCPGNYVPSNYLDAGGGYDNSSPSTVPGGITQMINGYVNPVNRAIEVNDRIVFITPQDIFDAVKARKDLVGTAGSPGRLRQLTQMVADCVRQYTAHLNTNLTDRRMIFAGEQVVSDYRSRLAYVDYPQNSGARLRGRVPYTVLNTKDELNPRGLTELLTTCSHWTASPAFVPWYENWKDHLYLAVAPDFDPKDGAETNTVCAGACLTVGVTTNVAAVVYFAGSRLQSPLQAVTTNSQRNTISNYLDGQNATRFTDANSGNNLLSADANPSLTNDIAYCVRVPTPGNVEVVPC